MTAPVKQQMAAGDLYRMFFKLQAREINLTTLERSYDYKDWTRYVEIFKQLVNDMDTQYLEIRAARKALFDHDTLGERGCDIDCESWRCDEKVKWDVYEPFFGAPNQVSECKKPMEFASRSRADRPEYERRNRAEPYKWGNGSDPKLKITCSCRKADCEHNEEDKYEDE